MDRRPVERQEIGKSLYRSTETFARRVASTSQQYRTLYKVHVSGRDFRLMDAGETYNLSFGDTYGEKNWDGEKAAYQVVVLSSFYPLPSQIRI
jgi:hypothetical protein